MCGGQHLEDLKTLWLPNSLYSVSHKGHGALWCGLHKWKIQNFNKHQQSGQGLTVLYGTCWEKLKVFLQGGGTRARDCCTSSRSGNEASFSFWGHIAQENRSDL